MRKHDQKEKCLWYCHQIAFEGFRNHFWRVHYNCRITRDTILLFWVHLCLRRKVFYLYLNHGDKLGLYLLCWNHASHSSALLRVKHDKTLLWLLFVLAALTVPYFSSFKRMIWLSKLKSSSVSILVFLWLFKWKKSNIIDVLNGWLN